MNDSSNKNSLLSHTATRVALVMLVPLAVLVGARALSSAAPLKVWTTGETLNAADLNGNFSALTASKSWVACGTLKDLNGTTKCEIPNFPTTDYEYGLVYNGKEVQPAFCSTWNVGLRMTNKQPYMVDADDPTNGAMQLGGFIFYTGTNAADDDIPASCAADTWRHHYWKISGGSVALLAGNACSNEPVLCRPR